jgi:hypothetical protein
MPERAYCPSSAAQTTDLRFSGRECACAKLSSVIEFAPWRPTLFPSSCGARPAHLVRKAGAAAKRSIDISVDLRSRSFSVDDPTIICSSLLVSVPIAILAPAFLLACAAARDFDVAG